MELAVVLLTSLYHLA